MSPGEDTLPLPKKKSSMLTNWTPTPREQSALQRQRLAAIAEKLSSVGPRSAGSKTNDQGYRGNSEFRWLHGTTQEETVGVLSTPEPEMLLNYVDDLDN